MRCHSPARGLTLVGPLLRGRRALDPRPALHPGHGPLGAGRVDPRFEHGLHRHDGGHGLAARSSERARRRRFDRTVGRRVILALSLLARPRRRLAGRSLRTPAHLPHRRGRVRRGIPRLRGRAERALLDPCPRSPGDRRGSPRALEPRDARRSLFAEGPRQGGRYVVRAHLDRQRHRSGARRLARSGRLLEGGLPDQPADRGGAFVDDPPTCPGNPQSAGREARRRRGDSRDARPRRSRLRSDRGADRRMGGSDGRGDGSPPASARSERSLPWRPGLPIR